jgi:hypothetical protein
LAALETFQRSALRHRARILPQITRIEGTVQTGATSTHVEARLINAHTGDSSSPAVAAAIAAIINPYRSSKLRDEIPKSLLAAWLAGV